MKKGSRVLVAGARVRLGRALAVAMLPALLGSCAGMDSTETMALADHPVVTVIVLPQNSACPPEYTCASRNGFLIGVSEDPIDLTKVTTNDNRLTWVITSAGWKFVATKGIDIKTYWKVDVKTDLKYSAYAKKNGAIYKYSINVTNGTVPVTWDPSIMN